MITTIQADEVKVGDKIYNRCAWHLHPAFRWVEVDSVSKTSDGKWIVIKTNIFDTYKHPLEGVEVIKKGEFV